MAFVYIIIALLIVMLPLFVIIFIFWSVYGTRFLYFNTDKTAKLIRMRKIKPDGSVKIDGKKFNLSNAKPIIYNRPIGVSPLYIIHHANPTPISMTKGEFQCTTSPSELQELSKIAELKAVLNKPKKDMTTLIIMAVMTFIMGFLMCFAFIATGIISF